MANRSFLPEDLVELPVRDADDAVALAKLIADAAHAFSQGPDAQLAPLPEALQEALANVGSYRSALSEVIRPLARTPRTLAAADRVEDNAVGAFYQWVGAFLRLPPGTPERARGEAIFRAFFGEGGLAFLRERPRREWAQVQGRIDAIAEQKLEPEILALGGGPFWTHLAEAHAAYGEAVGASALRSQEAPQVREPLDALLRAIRVYVVRVSASIDERRPETRRRADALLAPITNWETVRPRRPADDGEEDQGGGQP